MNTEFTGKSLALTQTGLTAAARRIAVNPAEVWAVVAVETCGCGFLPDRRPQMLFERHVFHRLTGGRFDDGNISSPTPGGYGPAGGAQYDRLARAIQLDRAAALRSASWGLGQIMGENFDDIEARDVETMVAAMCDSEDEQINAMAGFIAKANLAAPLQRHDWVGFASRYNGPSYAANQYDIKLADAFRKYSSGGMPDMSLRAAQLYLTFRGFKPGGIDGIAGARTRAAILEFQRENGLPQTGGVDESLLRALTY